MSTRYLSSREKTFFGCQILGILSLSIRIVPWKRLFYCCSLIVPKWIVWHSINVSIERFRLLLVFIKQLWFTCCWLLSIFVIIYNQLTRNVWFFLHHHYQQLLHYLVHFDFQHHHQIITSFKCSVASLAACSVCNSPHFTVSSKSVIADQLYHYNLRWSSSKKKSINC